MSSSTNAIFLSGNDEEEKDEELFGEDNEDVNNMLDTNVPSKTTETTGVANTINTSQSIFSTGENGGDDDDDDEDNEGGGFEDDDADDDLFMTTTTTSITSTTAVGSSHHRHPDALLDNLFSPAFRNNPFLQSTSDRFRSALARVEEYPKSDVNAWKIVLTEIHQAYPKFLRENFSSPENELKLDFMECVYGYLLRNFPYNSVHTQQILEILYQMSSLLSDEVSFIGSNNFSQALTPRQIKAQRKMDHLFQKTLGVTFDYIENLEDNETGESTKNQLPDFTMNPTDGMLVSNVDLWLLYIQKCTRDAERLAKNPSMLNNTNMNGTSDKQMKLRQLALNDKSKFIRNCISRAYEQTLEKAHSIPNCHLLWRNYLNFVKSWPVQDQPSLQNEQLQLTRKIYQSLISIPMAGLDDFWREYEQFERNWSSDQSAQVLLAEHLLKYEHARGVYIKRAHFISQISSKVNFQEKKNSQYPLFRWSTPPINQAQEYNSDTTETLDSELSILGNYKARCAYERTNPERKSSEEQNAPMVRQAYKEMICAFMRHPEAWHEWAMWELLGNPSSLDVGNNNKANKKLKKSKIGTNVKNCLQVFELARTQIPDSALLAISQAEVMELHGKNPKMALVTLEEFVKHRPCASGYVMLQKLVRRYPGMEEAKKVFSRARRFLKEDHSQRKDLLEEDEKEKDSLGVKSTQQRSIVKTPHLDDEWFKLHYSPLHQKNNAINKLRERASAEASTIKGEIMKQFEGSNGPSPKEMFIAEARLGTGKELEYQNPIPSSHLLSGHAHCALEILGVPAHISDGQISQAIAKHSSRPPLRICSTTVGIDRDAGSTCPSFCNSLTRTVWAIFINKEAKEDMIENLTIANVLEENKIYDQNRSMNANIIPTIEAESSDSILELEVEQTEIDAIHEPEDPNHPNYQPTKVLPQKSTVYVPESQTYEPNISVLSAAVSSREHIPRDKNVALMIARALDDVMSLQQSLRLDNIVEILFSDKNEESEGVDEDILDVAIAYLRRVHLYSFYNGQAALCEGDVLSGFNPTGNIHLRLQDADSILQKEDTSSDDTTSGKRNWDNFVASSSQQQHHDSSEAVSLNNQHDRRMNKKRSQSKIWSILHAKAADGLRDGESEVSVTEAADGLSDGESEGGVTGAADGLSDGESERGVTGAADGLSDGEFEGGVTGVTDGPSITQCLDEHRIKKYAFCCSHCTCSFKDSFDYSRKEFSCGNSGNNQLFHRGCCHKIRSCGSDSLSPMMQAIEKIDRNGLPPKKQEEPKPLSDLAKCYNQGKKDEAKFYNDRGDTAKDNEIYSNLRYTEFVQAFQMRPKVKSLRVLDLFCGIGSGTLVLKKLGIPLHTVVHVDHDPVAIYVNKYNNSQLTDGILHIYICKYEDICSDSNIEDLVKSVGHFDLVFGAAPCRIQSKVNAYRKQNKSKQFDYLSDVGRLIQKISEIQKNDVLFLSENVVFEKSLVDDKSKSYYGLPPVRLDARDFGPCKRDRLYWTNIRLNSASSITDDASMEPACNLLEDGYVMTETIGKGEGDSIIPKANTFMASKSRIDDNRMIKLKCGSNDKYYKEYYSVRDRELMLGFPEGYVEKAVNSLFKSLTQDAFLKPEITPGAHWTETLPEELHHFHIRCKFKCAVAEQPPFFQLEISAPEEAKNLEFFNEEQYCKHLLGNAWSIPVTEYMLSSLREICEDKKIYENSDYRFQWKPYTTSS